ncbi:MAG: DUF523 domain-containing protein, partial [Nitrospirae bacterium]
MVKIKIGISACLLGYSYRYDGGHWLDRVLKDCLGRYIQWIPVCPEVEAGFPLPREPMVLSGENDNPRLIGRYSKADMTDRLVSWIDLKLQELQRENLSGFIFKSSSPSCGLKDAKLYKGDGEIIRVSGLFAQAFQRRFPWAPVLRSKDLYIHS